MAEERKGYKHGKYVMAEPNPHVDLLKYKTKSKKKDKDDDKRYRVKNSEMHDKDSRKVKRQKKLDKSLDKQGYKPTLETQAKTRVSAFDNANRIRGGLRSGGRAGYKHGGAAKRGHGCEIK